MGIRRGSIVTIVAAEQSGPGGQNTINSGAEVVDIDNRFLVALVGSTTTVYPWSSIRRVEVTTY